MIWMTATVAGAGLVADAPAARPTLRESVARHGILNGVKWRVLGHRDPSTTSGPAPTAPPAETPAI